MASFLLGLLGGVVAWIAGDFVARPLHAFFGLRSEAATALARYERAHYQVRALLDPLDDGYSSKRTSAYETCGSGLVAFAVTNATLARLLSRIGFSPATAGYEMLALSVVEPATEAAFALQALINGALKLKLAL
jgi:hypothetical protein